MGHRCGAALTSVRPLWAIEGGRVTLEGDGFRRRSDVAAAGAHRRAAGAARRGVAHVLTVHRPARASKGARPPSAIDELPGETAFVEIGAPLVTGVHHVDSPAYDRHGNLYVTFSGSRGQQAPVSIFIVRPDGTREPFVSDVPNPTSLAFDRDGRLYVSSRFDGSVYRVEADGRATLYASDLGVACGLAFGPDGALYRRRSLGLGPARRERRPRALFASLPPSVAAFHLAFGPDGHLYVAAPTLEHARSRSTASRPTASRRRGAPASAVRRGWPSTRPAICTSSTRWRAPARSTASVSTRRTRRS